MVLGGVFEHGDVRCQWQVVMYQKDVLPSSGRLGAPADYVDA